MIVRDKTPALPAVPSARRLEDPEVLRSFLTELVDRLTDILDDLLLDHFERNSVKDSRLRASAWKVATKQ